MSGKKDELKTSRKRAAVAAIGGPRGSLAFSSYIRVVKPFLFKWKINQLCLSQSRGLFFSHQKGDFQSETFWRRAPSICVLPLGGDVYATADDGSSLLLEAAGGGNPDCIAAVLEYGGSGNVPNLAGHLPIHRAAYEGHYL